MDRNTNGAALISNGAANRLPNPPCCVGTELVSALIFELACGTDKADVALLNQVKKGHTAPDVFLCNTDDQTRIGTNQVFLSEVRIFENALQIIAIIKRQFIAVFIKLCLRNLPLLHPFGEADFFLASK